jgi:hypothetical protein
MPAFSNSPWSNGGSDFFNRVPHVDPNHSEGRQEQEQEEESQSAINQQVYQELVSDSSFVKVIKLNGCDVVIGKGNSSAAISVFYHDQREWESVYNDLPVPHSWREEEWHRWFDIQVFNLVASRV